MPIASASAVMFHLFGIVLSLTLVLRAIPLIAIGGGNQVAPESADQLLLYQLQWVKGFGPVWACTSMPIPSTPPAKSAADAQLLQPVLEFCRWWFPGGILNLVVKQIAWGRTTIIWATCSARGECLNRERVNVHLDYLCVVFSPCSRISSFSARSSGRAWFSWLSSDKTLVL